MQNIPLVGKSALQIAKERSQTAPLQTALPKLDALLNGGLHSASGCVEICGTPGAGKTQICMQLAATCQISHFSGECDRKVVYIDTEGGFTAERFVEIAHGMRLLAASQTEETDALELANERNFLKNVHLFRVFDYQELQNVLAVLPQLLQGASTGVSAPSNSEPSPIGLIVIDSISFVYRHAFHERWAERAAHLQSLGTLLNRLSYVLNASVVLTNHVTTNVSADGSRFSAQTSLIPALGGSWINIPTIRLLIEKKRDFTPNGKGNHSETLRTISLIKSNLNTVGSVELFISKNGIQQIS